MSLMFTEENGMYTLDCTNSIWATDSINKYYHENTVSLLKDVDWIVETDDNILLIEYKNATIKGASHPERFNPKEDKKLNNVAQKYYDTLHFLHLMGKFKLKKYIYILEYPNGDVVSRKLIRNKLKDRLPFRLQSTLNCNCKLIESVEVLSIEEWNNQYNDFPLLKNLTY